MRTVSIRTTQGSLSAKVPESWHETTTAQFIQLIKEWDSEDWIKGFSIVTGFEVDAVAESKNGKLEASIYKVIEYLLDPNFKWDKLPIPDEFVLQPMWYDDNDQNAWMPKRIKVPRHIGRMSIGQTIQARKSLEGLKDIQEGISIVTAIYLQPLIDKGKFDYLRAIEIEQLILKMSITKIYPIGFFLLRKLNRRGNWLMGVLNLLKQKLTRKGRT